MTYLQEQNWSPAHTAGPTERKLSLDLDLCLLCPWLFGQEISFILSSCLTWDATTQVHCGEVEFSWPSKIPALCERKTPSCVTDAEQFWLILPRNVFTTDEKWHILKRRVLVSISPTLWTIKRLWASHRNSCAIFTTDSTMEICLKCHVSNSDCLNSFEE